MFRATKQISVLLIWLFIFGSGPIFAQTVDGAREKEIRDQVERDQLARLAGWKTIVFICDPLGEEKRTGVKRQSRNICEKTVANIKAMADIAGVDVKVVDDWYGMGMITALTGALQLEAELTFSDCDVSSCALAARISAEFDYEGLVDAGDKRLFERNSSAIHPIRAPRTATVEFWSSGVMMVTGSDTEDFTTAAVSGLDSLLKQFFSAYAKANRP
jgi:hypothetical protein